jgi:hypothetical protein
MGIGTGCAPNPCAATGTGACCSPGGNCQLTLQSACNEGTWQGPGTGCQPNPCPQPIPQGACCFTGGECQVTTQAACNEGAWQGAGTGCAPNPCDSGSTGACCLDDGECAVSTEGECTGSYQGAGSNCAPNPCPPPVSGSWIVDISVLLDPHGHNPYIHLDYVEQVTVTAKGTTITFTGSFPWVTVQGTYNAATGAFAASGSGTVAGRSNVSCQFSGSIQTRSGGGESTLTGVYRMGNTTPPYQLPNGAIDYSVSGAHR